MVVTATYQGTVLAQSDHAVYLEGNYYFPPDAINKDYFGDSNTQYVHFSSPQISLILNICCSTTCPWKG